LDKDDPDYWQGELSNVRLLAGELYELQEMDAESGVDPDFKPSEDGLDTLCISGSAQFSAPQFRALAASLRECAGDKTIENTKNLMKEAVEAEERLYAAQETNVPEESVDSQQKNVVSERISVPDAAMLDDSSKKSEQVKESKPRELSIDEI
jgi:hypothetical protein